MNTNVIAKMGGTVACLAATLALAAFPEAAVAQERPYTEGTVWDVSYVRTAPGQFDGYLRDLAAHWKRFNDEAIRQGHIVSYKILSAEPGSPNDWDLMLLIEYPNMAALDDAAAKFDPIVAQVFGSIPASEQATVERSQLREILGGKLARELELK